jgi:hypothetical protein
MRNLVLVALALVVSSLAPFAFGANERGLAQVERAIKVQMNSGGHGRVTRDVRCAQQRAHRARCVLTSVTGTELGARVLFDGGEPRLIWEPLAG